ncbi:hypothetical protein J6590_004369 [Homalodisca vitripennis]|nr:hypothetical protein J6590_004369 [Homalodisca vitripennis]
MHVTSSFGKYQTTVSLVIIVSHIITPMHEAVSASIQADLASIHSPDEERFIIAKIRASREYTTNAIYWLGAQQDALDNWYWADTTPMTYTECRCRRRMCSLAFQWLGAMVRHNLTHTIKHSTTQSRSKPSIIAGNNLAQQPRPLLPHPARIVNHIFCGNYCSCTVGLISQATNC